MKLLFQKEICPRHVYCFVENPHSSYSFKRSIFKLPTPKGPCLIRHRILYNGLCDSRSLADLILLIRYVLLMYCFSCQIKRNELKKNWNIMYRFDSKNAGRNRNPRHAPVWETVPTERGRVTLIDCAKKIFTWEDKWGWCPWQEEPLLLGKCLI